MPSPFPGMNPYLEQSDVWEDFHQSFIRVGREFLGPQLSPNYIAKVEEHLYIHELPVGQRSLLGHADSGVSKLRARPAGGPAAGLLEAPLRVELPGVDIEPSSYIEIRDRQTRELVTVVEILSPTNKKPGADREQYLAKRAQVLQSTAAFVEIDLLRGWPRMPMRNAPACDYCVLLSRTEDRLAAGLWPIALHERLPEVPVPLRLPSPDARLDLQQVLHRVYDAAYYKDYIYDGTPEPALSAEDAMWAREVMAAGVA